MALTRKSESKTIYLQAKHFCLWQEIKNKVEGCESVQVTNPRTDEVLTKYGYKFDDVTGLVTDLVKYDTERKYETRYFGFKLHLRDGDDAYVLDMPYQSQILRRFLRIAPSVDWTKPLSITVFRGKKEKGVESIGVWFRQLGETVKPYYTKENPRGMPVATQDPDTQEWDFRAQHRWLIEQLKTNIIPAIHEAVKKAAPEPSREAVNAEWPEEEDQAASEPAPLMPEVITDDDVPF